MNIFYLAHNADLAAHRHCDQHINKMILESAQLLSTVVHVMGLENTRTIYKPTHSKHPCTVWMTRKFYHCQWVYNLAYYLNEERKRRFGSIESHRSLEIARNAYLILDFNIDSFPDVQCPVALAMPDECKTDDPVQAYQNYYCFKNQQWTKEGRPMKYYGHVTNPERFLTLEGTHQMVAVQ